MTQPVRTRFAPSPTGFLHIGGARTWPQARMARPYEGNDMISPVLWSHRATPQEVSAPYEYFVPRITRCFCCPHCRNYQRPVTGLTVCWKCKIILRCTDEPAGSYTKLIPAELYPELKSHLDRFGIVVLNEQRIAA